MNNDNRRDTYVFDYFKQLTPDKLRQIRVEKQVELYYLNVNDSDWEYKDHRISHLKDDIAVIDAILEGKLNGRR